MHNFVSLILIELLLNSIDPKPEASICEIDNQYKM